VAHLRNLDIDLLHAFTTVADVGGFTRAADILLRRQSTLSLQIKRLKDALGRRLLDRTSRRVRLTAAGESLLADARHMLELNDRLVARLNEPALAGTVRQGTPEDFATTHLPQVLSRFAQAYPMVQLEVTCDLTLNLPARFRRATSIWSWSSANPNARDVRPSSSPPASDVIRPPSNAALLPVQIHTSPRYTVSVSGFLLSLMKVVASQQPSQRRSSGAPLFREISGLESQPSTSPERPVHVTAGHGYA
jgi:hypothetical protein